MANTAVDIGTGASCVFGTSGIALNWTSIDLGEQSLDIIPTDHLGTTGVKTIMPGDLINAGEVTLECQWDNENGPVVSSTAETLTITFPQSASNTTSAATYAGTGVVSKVKYPTLGVEELQTGSLTFTWDGITDAAYTDAV